MEEEKEEVEEEKEEDEEEEEEKEEKEEEAKGTKRIDPSHCCRDENSPERSPNQTEPSSVPDWTSPKSFLLKYVNKKMDRLIICYNNCLVFSHASVLKCIEESEWQDWWVST